MPSFNCQLSQLEYSSIMETPSKFVEGPNGFRIEYRYDEDGSLDEVLLYHQEECLFHLECMGDQHWYAGLYLPGTEKNQHGIIPSSHALQMWFSRLNASNDTGDIKLPAD